MDRKPSTEGACAPGFGLHPLALSLSLALAGPAQSATVTVTSATDDGTGCTLREAMAAINAGVDGDGCTASGDPYGTNDTIVFAPALVGTTITLVGEILVQAPVSVHGPVPGDPTGIVVDADGQGRIFNGPGAAISIDLRNLTLTGGQELNPLSVGGAVQAGGNVDVSHCVITGNTASAAGGAIASNGRITVADSVISGNLAYGDAGALLATGEGTGITLARTILSDNQAVLGDGGAALAIHGMSVSESTVAGNVAGENGGGLFTLDGDLVIESSTLLGNSAGHEGGGAITLFGDVHIASSTLSGNIAGNDAGALFVNEGDVYLLDSTLSANVSGDEGGAIYVEAGDITVVGSTVAGNSAVDGGGGLYADNGDIIVIGSTITGNWSGHEGGGLKASRGSVVLFNSTVSGNSAVRDGGGITMQSGTLLVVQSTISGNVSDRRGGGLYAENGSVLIENSTIAANTAGTRGGGLSVDLTDLTYNSRVTVTVIDTIVADNTADSGPSPDVDLRPGDGEIEFSAWYSLLGTNVPALDTIDGVTVLGDDNVFTDDPGLGPLADNGGPTLTHHPLPGSPAVDAGSGIGADDPTTQEPATTDQRGPGFARISGIAMDIGAVEVQFAIDVTPTALVFPDTTPGQDSDVLEVIVSNAPGSGAPFAVGPFTLGGTTPQHFTLDDSDCATASPLAVGESCVLALQFTPLAAGQHEAVLLITSGVTLEPLEVPLSGRGLPVTGVTHPENPSLQAHVGGEDIGEYCGFTDFAFIEPDAFEPAPPRGYFYRVPGFRFTLEHCTPGATVDITLEYAAGLQASNTLLKLMNGTWQPYPADLTTSTVRYQVTDDGPADADPTPGVITDPVLPAEAVRIPTLSGWTLALLAALLGALGWSRARPRPG